jgi:hypothetical protein
MPNYNGRLLGLRLNRRNTDQQQETHCRLHHSQHLTHLSPMSDPFKSRNRVPRLASIKRSLACSATLTAPAATATPKGRVIHMHVRLFMGASESLESSECAAHSASHICRGRLRVCVYRSRTRSL